MKKAIKHIIPLCILLLFGNGSLFAHTLTNPIFATSLVQISSQTQNKTSKENLEHLFLNQSLITKPLKEFYRKKAVVSDNEEEDSEIVAAKKNLEKTTYIISVFNQHTHFISYYTNNSFAFRKEPSYLPSYKSLYIIFEVFRI